MRALGPAARVAVGVSLTLGAFVLGCSADSESAGSGAKPTFPAEPLATVASDHGALSLAVRTAPQQPPARGLVSVELVATDSTGAPVDGLELAALPWMPDMGHGASTKPTIEPEGSGRYLLSNVAFFMPGRWELRLSTSGAVNESATVAFQIP